MNNNFKFINKFHKIIQFTLLASTLSGCIIIGSSTVYKSNTIDLETINKIAYSQLTNEEILDRNHPESSNIYQNTVLDFFDAKSINSKKVNLSRFQSINIINTSEIISLCKENEVDAFLCTQVIVKYLDKYYYGIRTSTEENSYVEMKLFDKNGMLLNHSKHNTLNGNIYFKRPTATNTIKDGVLGVLNKIWKQKKSQ